METVKSALKKTSIVAIAFAVALSLGALLPAGTAHAKSASFGLAKSKTLKISYVPGNFCLNGIEFMYHGDKKLSKLKNSKSSVLRAGLHVDDFSSYIHLQLKKQGTTKVSFKMGSKKYSVQVQTYKYASPIKSIKIGSKNCMKFFKPKYMSRLSEGAWQVLAASEEPAKVKVVPNKGWKINKIYSDWDGYKKYKNGSKIKGYFSIEMKNTKTGLIETYHLSYL